MDKAKDWDWSAGQALRIFLGTTYGDLYGFNAARYKLLAKSWITQKTFNLNGRAASCLVGQTSEDLPPVLFLHGTPGNALDWTWFLKKAADRFAIHALDRPGFGQMDKALPRLDNDMGVFSGILDTFHERAIVLGHSLGGGLAARLAVERSDKVKGLVLLGASLDPSYERVLPIQQAALKPPLSWLLSSSVRNSNAELVQYVDFLAALTPRLSEITCPVTVIHSRDDRLVPYQNVDFIEKHCTKAAAINIISEDSGGHFLNKTRPEIILKALETYV